MDKERFSRQILLFGEKGQQMIEATNVVIIGVGGVGSHVAQQLAYLGVKMFGLVDADFVAKSNLNRHVAATEKDIGLLKVEVMKRRIKEISSNGAKVISLADTFVSYEGFDVLKKADIVFGCVDKDGARLILTEFCNAYEKPYLDIATDIFNDNGLDFGGRLLFSFDGKGCLHCKDELSQKEIRNDFASPEERSVDEAIYGVPQDALNKAGPSVVSLNGTLASIAVTEFIAFTTNIRPVNRHLRYRGMDGIITKDINAPNPDCYYCNSIRGEKDVVNVERYIPKEIVKE